MQILGANLIMSFFCIELLSEDKENGFENTFGMKIRFLMSISLLVGKLLMVSNFTYSNIGTWWTHLDRLTESFELPNGDMFHFSY